MVEMSDQQEEDATYLIININPIYLLEFFWDQFNLFVDAIFM